MANERDIQKAIDDLNSQEAPNYAKIARNFKIDRTTLMRRHKALSRSVQEAHSESLQLLTNGQEETLIRHINNLSDRGLPPTPQFLRNLVFEMVKKQPGKNWVATFCARHQDKTKSLYLRAIDQTRHVADNGAYFKHFYANLEEKVKKYHIKSQNIYNFDEKGFLLGLCHSTKRIVGAKQLNSKKILGASQDGSREFISLLACICADGTAIPPALIYQGTSGDLQDTWLEDFDHSSDLAYFATSEKGWTNEDLGIKWLEIFDRHTKDKAGLARRLLLVDGHSSHVNLRFIDYCDKNGILLVVLPPHSTHRLQPLDVGIFSPLAHAYSQEIDQLIQSSCGFSRLTKRSFWRLFAAAWERSVTFSNVKSAFAGPGIFPLEPEKVLRSTKTKTPSPSNSDNDVKRKTPDSVRGIRRPAKEIRKEQAMHTSKTETIIRACGKLAIRNGILQHELSGLRAALVEEKNKRKRGKGMGIFDKERPGEAQFFSPAKAAAVRQRAEETEFESQPQKSLAEEKRTRQAREKAEKARVKAAKAQERETKKQAKTAEREHLAIQREERKAAKLLQRQVQGEKKAQLAAERVARRKRGGEDLRPSAVKRGKIAMQERAGPKKVAPEKKQASKNRSPAVKPTAEVCGSGGNGSGQDGQVWRVSRTGRRIAPPRRLLD